MENLSQVSLLTNTDIFNSDMEILLKDVIGEEEGQFKYTNGLHEQECGPQADLDLPALSPTGTIPSREDWQGPFNFEIHLDSSTCGKRSWVYSTQLNKVFLDMSKSLLVGFKVNPFMHNLRIRALPVYSTADHIKEPVERCPFHRLYDDPYHCAHENPSICQCEKYNFARHLMMCSHSQVYYDYDGMSDRHSVVVPLDVPPAGGDSTTVEYRFTCKTSCARGMNRRPIDIVFTLETSDGQVVGRLAIGVKICSCPKRDKEKEEEDALANKDDPCPRSAKRKLSKNGHQARLKKIKNENIITTQDEDNEPDNNTESSSQISSLNCQIQRLEAMAAEQKEQLRQLNATAAEQAQLLRRLEAKIDAISTSAEQAQQLRRLEAKIDAISTSAEQAQQLRRLEAKIDALLGICHGNINIVQ